MFIFNSFQMSVQHCRKEKDIREPEQGAGRLQALKGGNLPD